MTTPPHGNEPDHPGDDSPTPPNQDPVDAGSAGGGDAPRGGATPYRESSSQPEEGSPQDTSPYGTSWQSPDSPSNQYPGYGGYGSSQQPYGGQQGYGAGQPGYGAASNYPSYGTPTTETTSGVRDQNQGFFGALFDFSFDNYVAVKFARVIYIIAVVMAAATLFFGWLVPALATFGESFGLGLVFLLLGWIPVGLLALVQLIFIRVFLEFVISSVKTAENTAKLVEQGNTP